MKWRFIFLALLIAQLAVDVGRSAETVKRSSLFGKVTDQAGDPLAGVRVDISTAAPKVGRGIFCPSCYLDCAKFATTDDRGEFKITELDPTLKFRLVIATPGMKTLQTDLVDPDADRVDVALQPLPKDIDPNRVVTGVVTTHLPNEPLELMAYRQIPGVRTIHYPSKVQPKLNAKEIRIVLDPKLGSGIEDLDQ